MTARAIQLFAAATVILTVATAVPRAFAQPSGAPFHLLDVPYVSQSEDLCGGAAVAMVMRFWGARDVYAETFSGLVDREAGGIRGEDLLRALHSRGWQAVSFKADRALVQSHLAAGRPPIALIQDRPGRFHYVVIVGWSNGRVVVHDPARAPFRVLDEKAFTDAWAQAGDWTLVATPPSPPSAASGQPPHVAASAASGPTISTPACDPMVEEGIRRSGAGDLEGARRLLEVAAAACPESAAPWRELAGLRALKTEWREAARDARQAVAKNASDVLAWRILATALYLDGHPDEALEAWNRVGEPTVDLVTVTGLERTRYPVAAHVIGLPPQQLLTRAALATARRRLAELPAAQTTRITYQPGENGRAQVAAVVLERPKLPVSALALAAIGVRSFTDRETAGAIASPSGGGELWTAAWRWWEHRPRVALGFAAPAPFGGTWGVDVLAERQSYGNREALVEETRRRAAFHVSDWSRIGVRWEAEAAVDSWRGTSQSIAAGLTGRQELAGDRLTVEARAGLWRGGVRTWTTGLRSEWRSATRNEGDVWLVRAGIDAAGSEAPLALWAGAGTGPGRDILLRAHPLVVDGVVRDGVFGRRVTHGGLEWRRWLQPRGRLLRVAPALFVDTARASHPFSEGDTRRHLDAGAGVRIALPGAGIVRLDLAHGLRDGANAFSVGWSK